MNVHFRGLFSFPQANYKRGLFCWGVACRAGTEVLSNQIDKETGSVVIGRDASINHDDDDDE